MTATSRDAILQALRAQPVPELPLPPIWSPPAGTRPDPGQRITRFAEALEAAAGSLIRVAAGDDLEGHLAALPAYANARRIASSVERAGNRANVDLAAIADPRELADVDFALVSGTLGVAENGTIWVDAGGLRQRVLPFITQHLGIVLDASDLVDDLHQAYERLRFEAPGFGTFLTGPSKTADIEQALVIGAHGARSLSVLLLDGPAQS